jgi:signal peptidase I
MKGGASVPSSSRANPRREAGKQPPAAKKSKPLSENFIRVWAPTLVAALFIITFNVQAFEIPSSSMEKTLLIGDHLLVDRIRFAPRSKYLGGLLPYRPIHHGDIIVFMTPVTSEKGMHLVKRVIGLPGDRIKLVNGVVYRNGKPLREPYVMHRPVDCNAAVFDPARDDWPNGGPLEETTQRWANTQDQYIQNGQVVVPPEHYFVMGDNRMCSWDSRYWGFVPQANIIGRPEVVYWSYRSQASQYEPPGTGNIGANAESWLSELWHFPSRTRWKRTFHVIH